MSHFIYADHAATTAVSDTALQAMLPHFTTAYGNPSSLYRFAQEGKTDLERARAEISACLNARPEEIYFTSGGTEADNWALRGVAELMALKGRKGGHIITSAIEHHAVLHTAQYLEKQGYEVTYLPVDGRVVAAAEGLVRVGQFKAQCFQRLFLLGSNLAVLVLTVEHMTFVDMRCTFIQMQRPVQYMNMVSEPRLELLNKLRHDRQQNFARSMVVLCSQLIDGFFRAGLAAGQQVGNAAVSFRMPNLGVTLILPFDELRIVGLVELPFHIRECPGQIIRVLWGDSGAKSVEAVPVDIAFGSFGVDVLAVGEVEIPVVVLGSIGAVFSGSSIVSCQLQINIPPFQRLGGVGAQQLCC